MDTTTLHGRLRSARSLAILGLIAGLGASACGPTADRAADEPPTPGPPDDPTPDVVRVEIETSEGPFAIDVHPDWAPLGAERFLHLVDIGYYDDARFHRVVPGFIVQWGLAGDPALTAEWMNQMIPDDPVEASNTRGRIAFAFTEPGTRATQVYINLVDNVRLDSTGFAPFGEVVEGMGVVDRLYGEYGEASGGGLRRGDQRDIVRNGNLYLDEVWPNLDRLIRARVVNH